MTQTPQTVQIEPAKKSFWRRASIVWIVPILALAVALGIAWTSYNDRGPLIYVVFDAATGVKAGETDLRYRDVSVGCVEKVGFTDQLQAVRVTIKTLGFGWSARRCPSAVLAA